MRTRTIFLVGASGVGKTAVAAYLNQRAPWAGRVHHFDSIGVPSPERMVEEHGSGEGWQKWATERWVGQLSTQDEQLQLLEGQTRPSYLNAALESAVGLDPVIVLLNCSAGVRRHRLENLRDQPELANSQMESWSAYLCGQAHALGLPVIDTDELEVSDVAARVEAIGLEGISAGSL